MYLFSSLIERATSLDYEYNGGVKVSIKLVHISRLLASITSSHPLYNSNESNTAMSQYILNLFGFGLLIP